MIPRIFMAAAIMLPILLADEARAEQDVVAERKASLQGLKKQMAALRDALGDGSPAAVAETATVVRTELERVLSLFPPESRTLPGSAALPDVWDRWDEFARLDTDAVNAARRIEAAATANAMDAAAQGFRALGEACNACHKQFRAR